MCDLYGRRCRRNPHERQMMGMGGSQPPSVQYLSVVMISRRLQTGWAFSTKEGVASSSSYSFSLSVLTKRQ
jgi:hypothetical protein